MKVFLIILGIIVLLAGAGLAVLSHPAFGLWRHVSSDGGYDKRFSEIHERFGAVDLAILENGQYNANWRYIHTTPQDLEKVILDLQARQIFTVHHDKYSLAMHPWYEPDSVAHDIAAKYDIHLLDTPIGAVVQF